MVKIKDLSVNKKTSKTIVSLKTLSPLISQENDTEIIEMAQAGDKEALNQLYKKYYQEAKRVARIFLGGSDLLEDTVQEVFMTMNKAIHRFKFKSSFKTFLFSIVRNHSVGTIRKLSRDKKKLQEIKENNLKYWHEDKNLTIEQEILNMALAKIGNKFREPLLLFEIKGFSYKEISETLSINEGTVKSRINTAKSKLLSIFNNKNIKGL